MGNKQEKNGQDKPGQKMQKKSQRDRNSVIGGIVFCMLLVFLDYQIAPYPI